MRSSSHENKIEIGDKLQFKPSKNLVKDLMKKTTFNTKMEAKNVIGNNNQKPMQMPAKLTDFFS